MTPNTLKELKEKFVERYSRDEIGHIYELMLTSEIADWFISHFQSIQQKQIEEIEKKYGKYGWFGGSFGYQGIAIGIKSYQRPEDIMRDDIIQILKK